MKPLETEQDYHAAMARLEQIHGSAKPGTPEGDEFEMLTDQIEDWERRTTTITRDAENWEAFQIALEAPSRSMPRLQKLLSEPEVFDAPAPHVDFDLIRTVALEPTEFEPMHLALTPEAETLGAMADVTEGGLRRISPEELTSHAGEAEDKFADAFDALAQGPQIRLSPADQGVFVEALLISPPLPPSMLRATERLKAFLAPEGGGKMIERKGRKVQQEVPVAWVCDACGKREESQGEAQEWLFWRHRGGYNSVFGDGDELALDLCQSCTKALLGHVIKTHGNAYLPKAGSPKQRKAKPPLQPLDPYGRNVLDELLAKENSRCGHEPNPALAEVIERRSKQLGPDNDLDHR